MAALAQRLHAARSLLRDRRGITALEYALIAAAVTTIAVVGCRTMFDNLRTFVQTVAFS